MSNLHKELKHIHKKDTIIRYIFNGVIMGFGELIPGVGAQTAAILMGIYDEAISVGFKLTDFGVILGLFIIRQKSFAELKKAFKTVGWKFFIFVAGTSIVTFIILASLLNSLLVTYPMYVFAGASGIILATIPIIYSEIKQKGQNELIVFLTSLLFFLIIIDQPTGFLGSSINPFTLLIAGIICSFSAILPGISISFTMLLIGIYYYILSTIHKFFTLTFATIDLVNIGAFVVGFNLGAAMFIKGTKYIMDKYPSPFLAFILGLIIASLKTVWPFIDVQSSTDPERMKKLTPLAFSPTEILTVILIAATTFIIILGFRYLASRSGMQISTLSDAKEIKKESKEPTTVTTPKPKKEK